MKLEICWAGYAGLFFSHASTFKGVVQHILRDQPGYRAGESMIVAKVKGREAYRLYVLIGARCMDASLEDLPTEVDI